MKNPKEYPQKEFDLIKEGSISFIIVTVFVLILAMVWKAPFVPSVTIQSVAKQNPVSLEITAVQALDGNSSMSTYGPPYNQGYHGNIQSVQNLGFFHPQTWWGTPYKITPAKADVLTPLSELAQASNSFTLKHALAQYQESSFQQQEIWGNNYEQALKHANVIQKNVIVPKGNYGPVADMMASELKFAKSGLLSGALKQETSNGVYQWNTQNNLVFLQDTVLANNANQRGLSGNQWGINHDEGSVPGPWWLTPYTFLYQIPPYSNMASGDEAVAYSVAILFLFLIFLPWIPGLNKLPRMLPVYKMIWRDWYKNENKRH